MSLRSLISMKVTLFFSFKFIVLLIDSDRVRMKFVGFDVWLGFWMDFC